MTNQNVFFIQIDKNRIVKSEAITFIRWEPSEKRYTIRIDGGDFHFDKEDGKKILSRMGIKP